MVSPIKAQTTSHPVHPQDLITPESVDAGLSRPSFFELKKCEQHVHEIVSAIKELLSFKTILLSEGRDSRHLINTNTKLEFKRSLRCIYLYTRINAILNKQKDTPENRLAVHIAFRKLGLYHYPSVKTLYRLRSIENQYLDKRKDVLEFINLTQFQVFDDRNAWMFIQKVQLANETNLELDKIPEWLTVPDWAECQVQPDDDPSTFYPFQEIENYNTQHGIKETVSTEELLHSPNPFGHLWGVYRSLKEGRGSITDQSVIEILKKQPTHRLTKFGRTLRRSLPHLSLDALQDTALSPIYEGFTTPKYLNAYKFGKYYKLFLSKEFFKKTKLDTSPGSFDRILLFNYLSSFNQFNLHEETEKEKLIAFVIFLLKYDIKIVITNGSVPESLQNRIEKYKKALGGLTIEKFIRSMFGTLPGYYVKGKWAGSGSSSEHYIHPFVPIKLVKSKDIWEVDTENVRACLQDLIEGDEAVKNKIIRGLGSKAGSVFLNREETRSLYNRLVALQTTYGFPVIQNAIPKFVAAYRIYFEREGKEFLSQYDDRISTLLYYHSFKPDDFHMHSYDQDWLWAKRGITKVSPKARSDPNAFKALDKVLFKELSNSRSYLRKRHFEELLSIQQAISSNKEWTPSKDLIREIKGLKVGKIVKEHLLYLVSPLPHYDPATWFLSRQEFLATQFAKRVGISPMHIPEGVTDLGKFLFLSQLSRPGRDHVLRGDENQKEIREFIVTPQTFERFWSCSTPKKIELLKTAIQTLTQLRIPKDRIESAVKDIVGFFRISLKMSERTSQSHVIYQWIGQVNVEQFPEDITTLNANQSEAIRSALMEWKKREFFAVDFTKSPKIVEAVPCLFIQRLRSTKKEHVFPWCALISERGVEAVVKKTARAGVILQNHELLTSATKTRVDLAKCDESGCAMDMFELRDLMKSVAKSFQEGKKIILLSQDIKAAPRGAEEKKEPPTPRKKRKTSKKRARPPKAESLGVTIRHPGLITETGESELKKARSETGYDRTKASSGLSFYAPDLPDWAQQLVSDDSIFSKISCELIKMFALETTKRIEHSNLTSSALKVGLPKVTPLFDCSNDSNDYPLPLLPLRSYQLEAVKRFRDWEKGGVNGAICLDTGLGKTRVGSEILLQTLIDDPTAKCLVVAPNRVKAEWKTQFEKTVALSAIQTSLQLDSEDGLIVKLLYIEESKSHKGFKKRRRLEQKTHLQRFKEELVFEAFPVVASENIERVKAGLLEKAEIFLERIRKDKLDSVRDSIAAVKTVEGLKRLINRFQHLGEAYVRVVVHALKELTPTPMDTEREDLNDKLARFAAYYKNFPHGAVTVSEKADELYGCLLTEKRGVIVTSKSQILALVKRDGRELERLKRWCPHIVIIDEAHQMLTESDLEGNKQEVLSTLLTHWIAHNSRALALTATPHVNRITDIIELLHIINPKKVFLSSINTLWRLMEGLKGSLICCKSLVDKGQTVSIEDSVQLESLKAAYFHLLWLKEMIFDPLIVRLTWEDQETVDACGDEMPRKVETTLKLIPTQEQAKQIASISSTVRNFLQRTHDIGKVLIHPTLYTHTAQQATEAFQNCTNKVQFVSQSAILSKLFLEQESVLTETMETKQKAIVFVKHKATANFLKHLTQTRYKLRDDQVFAAHSDIADSDQVIERFKGMTKEAAILFLLPKTGGAGLNFTDVGLNIMLTTEWTHEKDRQAKGRILRGRGVKQIVTVRNKIASIKHKVRIIKMKELLSNLFLSRRPFSDVIGWMREILQTTEAMMRADVNHAVVSPKWKQMFQEFLEKTVREFSGHQEAIEEEYHTKRKEALPPPIQQKELFGYYPSKTHKVQQFYHLLPMPKTAHCPPSIRVLQMGFAIAVGQKEISSNIFKLCLRLEEVTKDDIPQAVRSCGAINIGTTPQDCIVSMKKHRVTFHVYEWTDGWGSALMRTNTINPSQKRHFSILQDKTGDSIAYFLMVPNKKRCQPL